jgi:hypothetical protein
MGPLEILVLTFPGTQPRGELLTMLAEVEARPDLNVLDVAVVRRYADGTVKAVELADLPAGPAEVADRQRYAETRLFADEDIAEVAELVPEPDTSALAIVVEHTWPTGIAKSVRAAGGDLAATVQIPAEDVADILV